ncbi:Bug family tripartite tricarboxylate transporter substrate binding protein [Vreelandella boliviensis]|uniref:Bug family tripartite tricarboxylate transporter substrate binding protein n=1 Tax=Vreelandella boliviensis TaxID=223527 RepID=UPI001B8BC992|nr:tripartite tricarboxylate transporter substrate binding protein [Halomonas boliviensis]MBS3669987.1 tripartite tricarboxylate transporter substrate binding protein [Halomonas boliviensis]
MKPKHAFFHLITAASFSLTVGTSFAEDDYPNRPISIVVPFQAGGGVDAVARQLAEHLHATLNQPVVVDNKPGGSGMIGASAVARATPDGYTLLLGSAGEAAINPHIHSDNMTYNPVEEFAPITLIAEVPNVLVVNPRLPAHTLDELITYAKQSPHPLTYATSGVGNMQHLNGELLASMASVDLLHVPYRGAAGQLTDVVSGQVDMSFVSYAAARGFIESDRLRAIAVTSDSRIEAAPDIPTIAEPRGILITA